MNEKPMVNTPVQVSTPIHDWFGLSYASFLVLPRVLMESMSHEWQTKMSDLLKEYDNEFPGIDPEVGGTRVQCIKDNRLVETPERVVNYRRPDVDWVESMRIHWA